MRPVVSSTGHMGSHTLSLEVLSPFLEVGCCICTRNLFLALQSESTDHLRFTINKKDILQPSHETRDLFLDFAAICRQILITDHLTENNFPGVKFCADSAKVVPIRL